MNIIPSDYTSPTDHPFGVHQRILRERLTPLLSSLASHLHVDVRTALSGESKLFSSTEGNVPSGAWSLLTLLLTHLLAPDIDMDIASSVAVALECYVCSIDLLDDVMDEDQTPTLMNLGVPRALSASDALRTLASQSLLSLQAHNAPHIFSLLETLNISALAVAAGQTDDVLAEDRSVESMSLETCIAIAETKAGSIMQLACQLAAVCASASNELYQACSMMGRYLGIAHQLDNDASDLYDLLYSPQGHTTTGKTDLLRGKKTLPIVLAAQESQESTSLSDKTYSAALYTGVVQTWGISQLYRNRARSVFEQIEGTVHADSSLIRLLLHF